MSKHHQRQKMKALHFALKFVKVCADHVQTPEPGRSFILYSMRAQFEFQAHNTPAHVFRADRPKIDKRRARRHYRKEREAMKRQHTITLPGAATFGRMDVQKLVNQINEAVVTPEGLACI